MTNLEQFISVNFKTSLDWIKILIFCQMLVSDHSCDYYSLLLLKFLLVLAKNGPRLDCCH